MTTKEQQEAIRARLSELEAKGKGRLTPDMVLSDARKPTSPLHSYFEWDNLKAADSWRLEQARALIRSITVVITTERNSVSVVGYVRDPDMPHGEQGYTSVARIRTDKDRARDVLVDEFSRAAAALRRARELAIAFNLERDVDAVTKKIERLQNKVPENRANA